jgi:hypothetical protein
MENDIEAILSDASGYKSVNISDIGKYGKFINFAKMPPEYNSKVLFPNDTPFMFHTDSMTIEKIKDFNTFTAMYNLENNIKNAIKQELLNRSGLQSKIKEIKEKTKKKIDKLEEKEIKKLKLKEKFRLDIVEKYFVPDFKRDFEAESSTSSESTESSQ